MKVTYEIDAMDWSDQSGHEDRDRAVEALGEWFESLDQKTQLAIFYAQQYASDNMEIPADQYQFDPMSDGCPWCEMVFEAQTRILNEFAPWVNSEYGPTTGYNFTLIAKLKK